MVVHLIHISFRHWLCSHQPPPESLVSSAAALMSRSYRKSIIRYIVSPHSCSMLPLSQVVTKLDIEVTGCCSPNAHSRVISPCLSFSVLWNANQSHQGQDSFQRPPISDGWKDGHTYTSVVNCWLPIARCDWSLYATSMSGQVKWAHSLYSFVHIHSNNITELVDSISRDGPDTPYVAEDFSGVLNLCGWTSYLKCSLWRGVICISH